MDYIFRKLGPSEWSKLTYLSDPNTEVLPKTRNVAAYLDFSLYWHKCTICFQIRIYNKFDDFSFQIVNLFLNRIIFFAISYEVCLLQYTRISGVCFLRTKKKPQTTLHSFYAFRHELVDQLDIFVSKLTSDMLFQLYVDATTVVWLEILLILSYSQILPFVQVWISMAFVT